MLFSPSLFIFFLVIAFGRCQFVYNYEENDGNGSDESLDHSNYQYNSPSATNDQFQSRRLQNSQADQEEVQNTGSRSSSTRENPRVSDTQTQPPFEYVEETPRDDSAQRPRRRKYRRISREGTYVAPPQTPRVYSSSIFENIGLGQAPNGVYVPQDSFLNVLKNPSFRQNSGQYYPQSVPTYYHQPSMAQGPTFYVQPPSSEEKRVQPSAEIQPSVRYADNSDSSTSSDKPNNDNAEMPNRRRASQTGRQRRQRQPNRSNTLSEPTVDIDALRTSSDAVRDIPLNIPQAQQMNQQPSMARTRQRQTAQNHQNSIQVPRVYSPSIFQNVRLGEAPDGVHIPEDSLLNVLRSPTRSQTSPRNAYANSQATPEPTYYMDEEVNNFQPDNSEEPEPSLPDSRRNSRQRSRTNISVRSMERRTQYQSNEEEEPQRTQPAPASSQQQRRQQTQTRNSAENRRRDSNTPAKRPSSSRQEKREPSEPSQSTRQQQNYKPAKLAVAALPEDIDDDGIPGEAGINYPTLHTIPRTSFSCADQPHKGYYADLETSCQVFHLCQARGVKSSFLCSNGTIFSQEKFSCQWWYKVNCEESPKFYSMNVELYKTPEKKKSSRD